MSAFMAGAGATPDPIPNSAVKPGHADDTGGTGFQPVDHRPEACATDCVGK